MLTPSGTCCSPRWWGCWRWCREQQPVVVVLDDLQWADKASLQLLRHVIAADQPMRLLVLGTYRDSELSRSHPLVETLAALHRQHGVARIELTGLDDTGVVSLMEAAAGHTLDDAAVRLAHAVYRETDGNPFFVSEVLRHLAETGAISQDATGRWVAGDDPRTDGLARQRAGGDRCAGRATGTRRRAGVVAGRGDRPGLRPRCAGPGQPRRRKTSCSTSSTPPRLRPWCASSPTRPGHYSFAHALIQHTLYEDLGPTRRARAHRQVAEALEDLCGDRPGARVGELARHWFNATQPIDLAKAIDYSRQAGDAALGALAPADALRYYAQALDLYARSDDPDPILGIDLAIGLGTAQRQTGDPAFRDTLLDAARRAADLGDTERLVAAALANNRGIFSAAGTIDADKVEILEMALDRLATDDPDRALVLATLCCGAHLRQPARASPGAGRRGPRHRRILRRRRHHRAGPQQCLRSRSSCRHCSSSRWPGRPTRCVRAERVGDPVLLFWAAWRRAGAAARAGDIDEMDRCLEIMRVARRAARSADLELGAQLRACPAGPDRRGHRSGRTVGHGGPPDRHRQRRTRRPALLRRAAQRGEPPTRNRRRAGPAHRADGRRRSRARRHRWRGAGAWPTSKRAGSTTPVACWRSSRPPTSIFRSTRIWLAGMVAVRRSRHRVPGPEVCRAAVRPARAVGRSGAHDAGITADGPVSHFLGGLATVLGRYDEADAYFTQAAAFNDRADAKFFAARTNLSWGKMLAERNAPGDAERARDLLTKAHAAAAAHGYANVERRAAEALQHLD